MSDELPSLNVEWTNVFKRAKSGEHAFQYDDLVGVLRRDVDGVENRRQKCVEYRFYGIAPMPCRMPAMPVAVTSLQILPSASNE